MAKRRLAGLFMLLVTLAVVGVLAWPGGSATAQDGPNLLTNGALESPYYGQGSSTRTAPNGWFLWVGAGAPDAFPHNDKVQVLDGDVSWNIKQGYVVFTAAGYQRVSGFQKGEGVKFTAYGWVYTCNDTEYSCVIPDPPYRKSDTSASVSLKVGIDPTGGTDPNAASVQWSAVSAPYDRWAEMSVTVETAGDAVTVFMYATQQNGLAMNNVYWDKASLVRTTPPAPAATATPQYVPFVVPQEVQPDGSIIHTVQPEDTLSSIAVAYHEYGVTNESIAAINPGMKPNTKWLTIGQEIIILPPGSVDPVTGQLRPAGAPSLTPTATTQTGAAPAETALEGEGEQPPAEAASAETPPEGEDLPLGAETQPAGEETVPAETAPLGEEVSTDTMPLGEEAAAGGESDLMADTGTLCVTIYDDLNGNGVREASESPLSGTQIVLRQAGSEDTLLHYNGLDPFCWEQAPGQYEIDANLLPDYVVSAGAGPVEVGAGREIQVALGGAPADAVTAAPLDAGASGETIAEGTLLDELYEYSGLVILGTTTGTVTVTSTAMFLLLNRFPQ